MGRMFGLCLVSLFVVTMGALTTPTPSYADEGSCSEWGNGPYSSSLCDEAPSGDQLCGLCEYKCNVGHPTAEHWCWGECVYKDAEQPCGSWRDVCEDPIGIDECGGDPE